MTRREGRYTGKCPFTVSIPAMVQRWEQVAFLHWSYPASAVQRLLPPGLTVEDWEGRAWVGLVPFFARVRPPFLPGIPGLFEFPETNVRTYVRGPEGDTGVWFFSLDATRLAAVLAARASYRVPYFWSKMTVDRVGSTIHYRASRRLSAAGEIRSHVVIEIGEHFREDELAEFDHFLTGRFTMFGSWGQKLLVARAQHHRWPLRRAMVAECEDGLVAAAGLPDPVGPPYVHWSDGVEVRIGFPGHGGA